MKTVLGTSLQPVPNLGLAGYEMLEVEDKLP